MTRNLSWSPDVKHVARPSKKKERPKKNESAIQIWHPDTNTDIKHCGHITAHSRKHTKSTLLTIRKDGHRVVQLLINLPTKEIRRLYDGCNIWDVKPNSQQQIRLECTLGTVMWMDDKKSRKADAPGFRLAWLHGAHTLNVTKAQRPIKSHKSVRIRTRKTERKKRKF